MNEMAPAIEIRGLRKVFGATTAVDDLTLEVPRGEVFGFLGPNGAGKTTTVKVLMDLVRPTAGHVRLLGKRPGDPDLMRRVGFLPEHFSFPRWLTARGLLELHGRLCHLEADVRRRRAATVLERVGLADRADTRVGAFSKGMSQRIGLAQALVAEPELVFLDEPTSALDPLGRREVRDIIRELASAGVTVFLNSHLLGEVELTCDRVAIVNRGSVVRAGSLTDLIGPAVEVEIRADGLTDELVDGLSRWGDVKDRNGGRLILATLDEDVVPAVARHLVEGGAEVRAVAPRHPSLEELFVRELRDESTSPAVAKPVGEAT